MDPERLRIDAEDEPEPELADALAPAPEVSFRTPGGIVERSAELEQQVGQLRDQLHAMEREVYGARKMVRKTVGQRRVVSAVLTGGVGSTVGALLAMVLWMCGTIESAGLVLALVLPGWVFGALFGYRWESGDSLPLHPNASADHARCCELVG